MAIDPLAGAATVTVVDCSTGQITTRPMTDDEKADKAVLETQAIADKQAAASAAAQRDADMAVLIKAAQSDPTTAALLRVLGLA
jgi:hypothetical protein